MDETLVQVLLIATVFGLVFGPLTARSSHRAQPVQGGLAAHLFHLIGTMAFVAALPSVLATLILGGGFVMAVAVAAALIALSLLALLVFAVLEPAP
jgi:hypothetical protein